MELKPLILFLHLILVAGWLGCILVEAIYEHSIEPTDSMRSFVAGLHWTTDKYIEIPAFVGVLITGGLLASTTTMTPLVATKIGFGLLAIVLNAICAFLVVQRLAAVRSRDFKRYESLDHLQHKLGAIVLLGVIVALGIGAHLFANGA